MPRKLNVAIDVDNTLTNTEEYLQPYLAEYFGVELSWIQAQGISSERMPEMWERRRIAFGRAYFDRVIPDTPFKPDAAWGVNALRACGHRIVIITARTPAIYTDPYATTAEELRRGGIVYDKLICATDKAAACRTERIDVLIDDHPDNCRAVAAAGIAVIQMAGWVFPDEGLPWPRVRNWAEAAEAVARLASEKG